MNDITYTETNQADTLNRLDYLLQVVKDRQAMQRDDEGWEYGFDRDAEITISTAFDGALIRPSKTLTKQWIKDSWDTMRRRYDLDDLPHYIASVSHEFELELGSYNRIWLRPCVRTERSEQNKAYLAEAEKAREEVYSKHYGDDEE